MMCGKGVNQAKEFHLQQSQPGMVKALKRLSPLREHESKEVRPGLVFRAADIGDLLA